MRRSQRLPLEQLAPYLLEPPDPPRTFDWSAVFGNPHPVEIEVGFGKGLFLLNASMACPNVNFVGIEILRKYQLFTATRIAKRELRNVRLAKADARLFLRDCVASDSVQALHAYFPDPWWKKRHHKRRLFTPDFVRQCERVLWPGGKLNFVSDVQDYFEMITQLVGEHTRLVRLPPMEAPSRPAPLPQGERGVKSRDDFEARHDFDDLTNFERKFRQAGRQLFRALYEKARLIANSGGSASIARA